MTQPVDEAYKIDRSRLRQFVIPTGSLLDLIAGQTWDVMGFPRFTEIPEGAVFKSVHHDHSCRAFVVTIQHESFEPVDDGHMIPRHDSVTQVTEYVAVPVRDLVRTCRLALDAFNATEPREKAVAALTDVLRTVGRTPLRECADETPMSVAGVDWNCDPASVDILKMVRDAFTSKVLGVAMESADAEEPFTVLVDTPGNREESSAVVCTCSLHCEHPCNGLCGCKKCGGGA